MMKNTDTKKRPRRSRLLLGTSTLLVSGLLLAGCTAGSGTASTGASSASTSTSVSTTSSTVTAASQEVASSTASTTAETIANTTAAVEAFLATLSDEQREAVGYDYDDETKTTSWSNFPVTFVDRAGLNIAASTAQAAEAMVAAGLGITVTTIDRSVDDRLLMKLALVPAATQHVVAATKEGLGPLERALVEAVAVGRPVPVG